MLGRNTEKSEAAAAQIRDGLGVDTLAVTPTSPTPKTSSAAADEVLEAFGRIDILFNNAGINIRKPPQEMTLAEWNEVMNANLTSAFLMSKAVYPAMKRGAAGRSSTSAA